jgi:hypothetical protein
MNAPFQCWREADGTLWVSPGHAIGIHSSGTVEFSTAKNALVGAPVPPAGGAIAAVTPPAGERLVGGNGRHWKISGGPADPDFPTGVFRPDEPSVWAGGDYPLASLTEAGDGSLSLHDGTDEVGTASGAGLASGVAGAGTFPAHDFGYDALDGVWKSTTDSDTRVSFYSGNGRLSDGSGFIVASRTGILDSPLDPSGVYVATTYGKDTYNGGAAWSYTVTLASGPTTMTATSYGEATYNGSAGFTFDAEFEGDIAGRGCAVAVTAGTAQEGIYSWAGWQAWASNDWGITIDGTGEASWSDGTGVVAVRTADSGKLYDPSGPYELTTYGRETYGVATPATSGEASAGTVPDQDFVLASDAGGIETHNGTTDPSYYVELDTATGDAIIYDGTGAICERLGGATADIDGSYLSTDYGAATYNGEAAFTYDIATANVAAAFEVAVSGLEKFSLEGYVYVVLQVDSGTNELEGIEGPFFAATLPANTSTAKSFPIAKSDGAGVVDQIQIGPIIWRA